MRAILRLLAASAMLALVVLAAGPPTVEVARPTSVLAPAAASTVNYNAKGFDACTTPTASQMQTWYTNSPYFIYYFYLGGSQRAACGGATITTNWVNQVENMGWGLVPIWVGPQMNYPSCQTHANYGTQISLNTTTAYNQGHTEATNANYALANVGISVTNNPPLVYDLEAYNGGTTCRNAAKAFINGWDAYLAVSPAQRSGVYGSGCASYLSDFAGIAHVPNFIFGADANGNPSTATIACVPAGYWTASQRHKQYTGGHNETWGPLTLSVDDDCANGPVWAVTGSLSTGAC